MIVFLLYSITRIRILLYAVELILIRHHQTNSRITESCFLCRLSSPFAFLLHSSLSLCSLSTEIHSHSLRLMLIRRALSSAFVSTELRGIAELLDALKVHVVFTHRPSCLVRTVHFKKPLRLRLVPACQALRHSSYVCIVYACIVYACHRVCAAFRMRAFIKDSSMGLCA